jgi:hypothetical protein
MHIMIDLETMGTRPSAAIVSIGAVIFDEHTLRDQFYATVDLQSAIDSGATVSGDTVKWWLRQSEDARLALADYDSTRPIREVLENFRSFVQRVEGYTAVKEHDGLTKMGYLFSNGLDGVWGNGAAFDNVVLAESYRRLGMEPPWPFFVDRCYRTMKNLHPTVRPDHTGTAHNALDDAVAQALHLQRMWSMY